MGEQAYEPCTSHDRKGVFFREAPAGHNTINKVNGELFKRGYTLSVGLASRPSTISGARRVQPGLRKSGTQPPKSRSGTLRP